MPTELAKPTAYGESHIGAVVQAIVLGGFLAGAGVLAFMAGSSAGGPRSELGNAGHAYAVAPPAERPVVVAAPAPGLLVIVLVENEERAADYRSLGQAMRMEQDQATGQFSLEAAVVASDAEAREFLAAQREAEAIGWFEPLPAVKVYDLRGE